MKTLLQLTKEQTIEIHRNKTWENWSLEERARFQFYQDRLCMPFDVFHEAFEKTIGRPVFTHEFARSNRESLSAEFEGKKGKPSFDEIINLIPEEKRILVLKE